MKYYLVLILMFCLHIELFAQSADKLADGFNVIYYPNGKVSSKGFIRNGKPDGYWKTYYPSGVIKTEGKRTNFLLDSTWIFYTESGDTLQKVDYILGKKNGFVVSYSTRIDDPLNKGRMTSKELFVNDKREGKSVFYYPSGVIKEIVEFAGNKRNGLATEYDLQGVPITVQRYRDNVLIERERINRSDGSGKLQGIWREYYPSGQIRKEMFYLDGYLDGAYKEYSEEGNVLLLIQYSRGNIVKPEEVQDMDVDFRNEVDRLGRLVYSGAFRNDIPIGIHRRYDSTGNVNQSFIYSDEGILTGEGILTNEGKREGEWKYYFPSGSVRSRGNYVNNLENGKWSFYFENGKPEQVGIYKNGKADGLWQWFFSNGQLKREEEYFNGKEEGISIEYDTLGNIVSKGNYFDGLKEGEWEYHAGDYSEKGKYVGDLRDGEWKGYYSDGAKRYSGSYIQGNPDGEHVFYYQNGKIKELNYFVMGISEKNWKKFDEQGNLLITVTFKDNREFRINGEQIEFETNDVKLIQ